MNDLHRFQALQLLLVEGGFSTTLAARREGNEAVFSLLVDVDKESTDEMAALSELTTKNGFVFTIEHGHAAITLLGA